MGTPLHKLFLMLTCSDNASDSDKHHHHGSKPRKPSGCQKFMDYLMYEKNPVIQVRVYFKFFKEVDLFA